MSRTKKLPSRSPTIHSIFTGARTFGLRRHLHSSGRRVELQGNEGQNRFIARDGTVEIARCEGVSAGIAALNVCEEKAEIRGARQRITVERPLKA